MVFKLWEGDTLETLKTFASNSVDSVCTDPPYGIKFMGRKWDYQIPGVEVWREVYRVLKPGGHVLCACGTRTQHRMTVNIEDAGFEIRDVITWHYGSGFPKSLDISKAIDREAGVDTEGVKQWEGFGTALKPATEFWTLARKPIDEDTVADNVLNYGTGALNIDGCRIEGEVFTNPLVRNSPGFKSTGLVQGEISNGSKISNGRFPANVIFDDFTGVLLDEQSGHLKTGRVTAEQSSRGKTTVYNEYKGRPTSEPSEGGASRFFYCAKASQAERDAGLEEFEKQIKAMSGGAQATTAKGFDVYQVNGTDSVGLNIVKLVKNFHPTVKPVKLMRYFVRLITPPGGVVLDPYNGSGTTGCACMLENFKYVGIEREAPFIKISKARLEYYQNLQLQNWLK